MTEEEMRVPHVHSITDNLSRLRPHPVRFIVRVKRGHGDFAFLHDIDESLPLPFLWTDAMSSALNFRTRSRCEEVMTNVRDWMAGNEQRQEALRREQQARELRQRSRNVYNHERMTPQEIHELKRHFANMRGLLGELSSTTNLNEAQRARIVDAVESSCDLAMAHNLYPQHLGDPPTLEPARPTMHVDASSRKRRVDR